METRDRAGIRSGNRFPCFQAKDIETLDALDDGVAGYFGKNAFMVRVFY